MTTHITSAAQFQDFNSTNSNVIVSFFAEGSEPCKLMEEAVEELVAEGLGFKSAKACSSERA